MSWLLAAAAGWLLVAPAAGWPSQPATASMPRSSAGECTLLSPVVMSLVVTAVLFCAAAAAPAAVQQPLPPPPPPSSLRRRPPGPYSTQLVPPLILFPEPRQMRHGDTSMRVAPENTTYLLGATASRSPLLGRAVARYLGGGGTAAAPCLMFPWGRRPPATKTAAGERRQQLVQVAQAADVALTIHIEVESAAEELQHGVDESYNLTVSENGMATLLAPSVFGALKGLETLSQLVVPGDRDDKGGYFMPLVPWEIQDRPEHSWRGLMLDTSRRFYPMSTLKAFIDAMAQHKLNVLHWCAVARQPTPESATVGYRVATDSSELCLQARHRRSIAASRVQDVPEPDTWCIL
jgi:hypothetical protein